MITVEKAAFDSFMFKFKAGEFQQQRLGQAFYNHFYLHRVADQSQFGSLYELDGEEAKAKICQIVTFS